jgi:ABC-type glycerol-3-phosphate transport system permease component
MFLPISSHIVGSIFIINELNLGDNLFGIVIPFIINLRIYFYLKDELNEVSKEIFESLIVDGSNLFQIINLVFFGVLREKILFSSLLIFVSNWNNFIIPINLISNTFEFTIPILIASISDPLNYFIGETFVALLIQTAPVFLIYILLSKSIDSNYELSK